VQVNKLALLLESNLQSSTSAHVERALAPFHTLMTLTQTSAQASSNSQQPAEGSAMLYAGVMRCALQSLHMVAQAEDAGVRTREHVDCLISTYLWCATCLAEVSLVYTFTSSTRHNPHMNFRVAVCHKGCVMRQFQGASSAVADAVAAPA
jgi:hypothetical protein